MKLLLLEHIVGFAQSLVRKLPAEGFDVECLSSDVDIVRHATSGRYRLVMLDVCEPVFGTFEVLKQIRRRSSIPIILLTDRDDELDRIVGLELGADDFVHKQITVRELTARIRAVLRRFSSQAGIGTVPSLIVVGDLTLDPASRTVRLKGSRLSLTSLQFDILSVLLEAADEIVTRTMIAARALKEGSGGFDRRIDMHISKLRRKLGPVADGERIVTVRGAGYMYVTPSNCG